MSPGTANEGGRGMTATAIQGGRNVRRIRRIILAGRGGATVYMAGITTRIVGQGTVIEGCRNEALGIMASTTICTGRYMASCFTRGYRTVMTRRTVIHDTGMIKGRRDKARGLMTHAAILIGGHVGTIFAYSGGTVMTRGTIVNHTRMIKSGAGKGRGVMADGAIFCRWDMGR